MKTTGSCHKNIILPPGEPDYTMNLIAKHSAYKLIFESILPVLMFLLFSWLFRWYYGSWTDTDWHVALYSRFIFWLMIALLVVYAYRIKHEPFLPWQEQPQPFGFYVGSVVVLYLLVIVAGLIAAIPQLLGWHDNNVVMSKMLTLMNHSPWIMVFGAATAGITEELMFRGFMQPRLQVLLNSKAGAIVVSSLLFASLHYRYFSLKELIGTFLIGVIFATHYQKYRNIKIVMIAHFMVDLIAFLLGGYAQRHHIH